MNSINFGYIKPGKEVRDCRNCAKAEKCLDFGVPLNGEKWCDCWRHQKVEIKTEIFHSTNALKRWPNEHRN